MANNKVVILILSCLLGCLTSSFGQVLYESWPILERRGDTIVRNHTGDFYFDYFKQYLDSFAIIDFSNEKYREELEIDERTGQGYLKIYFRDKIIFKYNFCDQYIRGVGIKYNWHDGSIDLMGFFNKSLLNGVLVDYSRPNVINYIALYEKGKFKEFVYHCEVRSTRELRYLNRKEKNPLEIESRILFDK